MHRKKKKPQQNITLSETDEEEVPSIAHSQNDDDVETEPNKNIFFIRIGRRGTGR